VNIPLGIKVHPWRPSSSLGANFPPRGKGANFKLLKNNKNVFGINYQKGPKIIQIDLYIIGIFSCNT
jgi:hypothetical protein